LNYIIDNIPMKRNNHQIIKKYLDWFLLPKAVKTFRDQPSLPNYQSNVTKSQHVVNQNNVPAVYSINDAINQYMSHDRLSFRSVIYIINGRNPWSLCRVFNKICSIFSSGLPSSRLYITTNTLTKVCFIKYNRNLLGNDDIFDDKLYRL
jgi:hypothetical protein